MKINLDNYLIFIFLQGRKAKQKSWIYPTDLKDTLYSLMVALVTENF